MNDADKLAIAEEKLTIAKAMTARWRSYDLPDILVKEEDGVYQAHRRGRDGSVKWRVVVSDACPVECVYLARQKLAAEREAAKSEREKRLEEFARTVMSRGEKLPMDGVYFHKNLWEGLMKALEKALEI